MLFHFISIISITLINFIQFLKKKKEQSELRTNRRGQATKPFLQVSCYEKIYSITEPDIAAPNNKKMELLSYNTKTTYVDPYGAFGQRCICPHFCNLSYFSFIKQYISDALACFTGVIDILCF